MEINKEVGKLSDFYMERLELPSKAASDAIHIAIACTHEVDYLVTWNCSHIANGAIIKKVIQLNSSYGLKTAVICTPEELVEIEGNKRPYY